MSILFLVSTQSFFEFRESAEVAFKPPLYDIYNDHKWRQIRRAFRVSVRL